MNAIPPGLPAHLMQTPEDNLPKAKNTLGKDDFMKLLLAQLQHQDPLKPMDHQEFSAQLAQFGSLEQLTNIGKGISDLKQGFGGEAKLQAVSLLGKRIQATGNEVQLMEGQPISLAHSLPQGFKPVRANIYGPGGDLVREISVMGKEGQEIVWDGKSNEGANLPTGRYTYRVSGLGPNGQTQEAGAGLSGTVTGLEMEGTKPVLVIQTSTGKSKIDLEKVQNVSVDQQEPVAQKPKVMMAPQVAQAPREVSEDAEQEVEAAAPAETGDTEDTWEANSRNGRLGDLIAENPLTFRP